MTDTIKPRWYVVCTEGLATLCASEGDALTVKEHADIGFPRRGPHQAVQLVDAASVQADLDAAVVQERLRIARALALMHAESASSHNYYGHLCLLMKEGKL